MTYEQMKTAARETPNHVCAQTINGERLQVRWDKLTGFYHWSYGRRGSGPCSLSPQTVRDIIASAREFA